MRVQMYISYWTTFLLSVFVFFGSCGQEHKKDKTSMKNRPIEQLYTNVAPLNYPSMPQYFIEGHQSGCYYEIYVNGILSFKHYENVGLSNHAVPINDVILKSGTQRVTVKLFPLGRIGNKEYKTLEDNTRFRLKIFKRDKATPWEGLDYDIVKEYFAPTTTGKDTGSFKNVGVPMFEETFTFEAEVPYKLTGWSESINLQDMDEDILEQEILNFYQEYDKIIQNQNEKGWVEMIRNKETEYFKSVYYNDSQNEEVKLRIAYHANPFDTELVESIPLDKYEIVFGGDGKVVTLKSTERLGMSAYSFAQNKDRNGKRAKARTSYYLFLHKPKGSNKLEIIR
ncbi:hypothetical protein [Aquimarina longa]|uniref:hypothetical protein n=1 Tax=Aquimarina longa TaxID=1080221 RepID=UPI000780328B|nr:hypothetical protein [Aquimarina longa]